MKKRTTITTVGVSWASETVVYRVAYAPLKMWSCNLTMCRACKRYKWVSQSRFASYDIIIYAVCRRRRIFFFLSFFSTFRLISSVWITNFVSCDAHTNFCNFEKTGKYANGLEAIIRCSIHDSVLHEISHLASATCERVWNFRRYCVYGARFPTYARRWPCSTNDFSRNPICGRLPCMELECGPFHLLRILLETNTIDRNYDTK